jgi:hypothetical protein
MLLFLYGRGDQLLLYLGSILLLRKKKVPMIEGLGYSSTIFTIRRIAEHSISYIVWTCVTCIGTHTHTRRKVLAKRA